MQLHLQHIVPQPLAEKNLTASEIWNKDVVFNSGEYIHVHAPSGTGKSTFLHILYGLRRDYTGTLFLQNKKLSESSSGLSKLRKQTLSIVFQDMRLFPSLTGMQNLMVKNALTNTAQENEIKEMMQQLGVSHLENKPAATMSLGEQQRIAIIRAMQQPFEWLLLDEPFSHLDTENIQKAKTLMLAVCKKNNAGLIIATLGETYAMQFNKNLNL